MYVPKNNSKYHYSKKIALTLLKTNGQFVESVKKMLIVSIFEAVSKFDFNNTTKMSNINNLNCFNDNLL